MRIKRLNDKEVSTLSVIGFIILVVFIVYSLIQNNEVKRTLESRNNVLDVFEVNKDLVLNDISLLLNVKDEDTYNKAREYMNLSKDLKTKLFEGSYFDNKDKFIKSDSFKILDCKYTLEYDNMVYYVLVEANRGNTCSTLNMLVYVKDSIIYKIVSY